jgi:probable HAF family extracellular repeat protein
MSPAHSLAALLLYLCFSQTVQAQTYKYRITEIDTTGFAQGARLNNAGNVTGTVSGRCPGCSTEAYLWAGKKTVQYFGPLSTEFAWFASWGHDVNYLGQVTGRAFFLTDPDDINSEFYRAFFWDGAAKKILGTLGGDYSVGLAINATGRIAGNSGISGSNLPHAFMWDGTTMHDLGTLGGCCSTAAGINNAGYIVGNAVTAGDQSHAFLWDGLGMRDLGTLGGTISFGADVNAKNQVVGWSSTASGATHAFLWQDGLMQDLGAIRTGSQSYSQAHAINNAGQVVGFSFLADNNTRRAVLWENGKLTRLNHLDFGNDPVRPLIDLTDALDINNLGQMLAEAFYHEPSNIRAVLVSPAYEMSNFLAPTANSWRRGSTVRIAIAVLDSVGVRIPDARAVLLSAAPCRVKVSASGAQTLASTCMKYERTRNEFYFDWKLDSIGTGAATIDVRVNYGAPGPLKVRTTRSISIVN